MANGNASNTSMTDDSMQQIRKDEAKPYKRPCQEDDGLRRIDSIQATCLLQKKKKAKIRTLVVDDHTTPSRTLIIPMVKLQEKLVAVNKRVTSGLGVSHAEWEDLRAMMVKLGDKFSSEVKFEWEEAGRENGTPMA